MYDLPFVGTTTNTTATKEKVEEEDEIGDEIAELRKKIEKERSGA